MQPIKASVINPGGITYYETGAGWGPGQQAPEQPKVDVYEWRRCESCRDSSHEHWHITQGKSVAIVARQVGAAVGKELIEQLESWGEAPMCPDRWVQGRIMVSVVRGTSEGWYIHVRVLKDEKSTAMILGKSFDPDLAWQVARKIADVLEV